MVCGLKGISPSLVIFFQGIRSLADPIFLNDGGSLNKLAIKCHLVCGRVLRIRLQDQLCSQLGTCGERYAIVVMYARHMFTNQLPSTVQFLVQHPFCEDRRGYLIPLMGHASSGT